MDAKPHRPARQFAAQTSRDENLPLDLSIGSSKQLDARAIYPSTVNAGSSKAATKRSAFGDLSNVSHYVRQNAPPRDTVKHTVNPSKPARKMAPSQLPNKENVTTDLVVKGGKPKPSLLQPPQRPANGARSLSGAYFPPQNDHSVQPGIKHANIKSSNLIYQDAQQQKPSTLTHKYTSQPQLKSSEAPFVRRTKSKNALQGVSSDVNTGVNNGGTNSMYSGLSSDMSSDLPQYSVKLDENDHFIGVIADYEGRELLSQAVSEERRFNTLQAVAMPRLAAHVDPNEGIPPPPAMQPLQSTSPSDCCGDHDECWDEDDDEEGFTTGYGDNTTGFTSIVAPMPTDKVLKELEAARLYVEEQWISTDDHDDSDDETMVAEYGEEIFKYMREVEARMLPNSNYMLDVQVDVQWSMRSILMDWVVQVHNRFNLLPETLFLTVNLIDRFLSDKLISVAKLQLVGATALLIAAKYEEIDSPSVTEMAFMVDYHYTTDEILKAERFMLSMLGFELGWPGPMSFLRRISKADEYDHDIRTLAKYFLEVTIMDERFVGCTSSYIAAGAYGLAKAIIKKRDWKSYPAFRDDFDDQKLNSLWHPALVHFSGFTWTQLKPVVGMILECCQSARKHHEAVYEKYADRRFKKSSFFVQNELCCGFQLPFQYTLPYTPHRNPTVGQSTQMRFPPRSETNGALVTAES